VARSLDGKADTTSTDASEKAIAAVAYLRTLDKDGNPDLGFVLGKAKVAHTNDINSASGTVSLYWP
jgi:hypothetical protein